MLFKFLFVAIFAMFSVNVNASTTNAPVGASIATDDMERMRTISILQNDITILDSELRKCQKEKKGWIAATVIGSAGVVATGVAAGVQGAQIVKKKETLKTHNAEINQKQQELNSLKK